MVTVHYRKESGKDFTLTFYVSHVGMFNIVTTNTISFEM